MTNHSEIYDVEDKCIDKAVKGLEKFTTNKEVNDNIDSDLIISEDSFKGDASNYIMQSACGISGFEEIGKNIMIEIASIQDIKVLQELFASLNITHFSFYENTKEWQRVKHLLE